LVSVRWLHELQKKWCVSAENPMLLQDVPLLHNINPLKTKRICFI
jgi:hypothetical protein